MNANSEVMQPVATPPTRQIQDEGRGSRKDASPQLTEATWHHAADCRLSEDPMRRTDRYRLVMPYSSRV